MTSKDIKALEMVRRIREAQYAEIKGMTHQEIIAYFRKKAQENARGEPEDTAREA